MKDITKEYSNGEITIVWKPARCIHSGNCFRGLGDVFDPRRKPWIKPENAATEQLVDQVGKCPSGALTYFTNDDNSPAK
ncbi:MAG: (4Fe-4S)-binding protein [Bacteroidia bacterium]|nr:(4Fe-4S)-binding protein [Bacteroidia bacterium]